MEKQNYQLKDEKIKKKFIKLKKNHPERFNDKLKLSWSNWGFGLESLEDSIIRLKESNIDYIELHGNHYGEDIGYKVEGTVHLLEKYNMKVSGVCGMFSKKNDLSSNIPNNKQAAISYIKRELSFIKSVGGEYLLVVSGAVGRPKAYDNTEFERSMLTLRGQLGDLFEKHEVKAAIEPVRAAEVSFVHTIKEAKEYIAAVNHRSINHINGDIYHMQSEESHIGEAILGAGEHLVNLHIADSNRGALGEGFMDIDTIIMALYIIGYNQRNKFITPEPLGSGGTPYPAMNAVPNIEKLNHLVKQTATYFMERESELLKL